jgi:hypothetical protein
MTDQKQIPLVGPVRRRGWRQIFRFRPLTSSAQTALVATRRGRLVSVIPANGVRVLSDYLTLPYDFREVDLRERAVVIEQRFVSYDPDYGFEVALKLTYQLAHPERVALELEGVQDDLARSIVQHVRQVARSFGVEQAEALEDQLNDGLLRNDTLVKRAEALG